MSFKLSGIKKLVKSIRCQDHGVSAFIRLSHLINNVEKHDFIRTTRLSGLVEILPSINRMSVKTPLIQIMARKD